MDLFISFIIKECWKERKKILNENLTQCISLLSLSEHDTWHSKHLTLPHPLTREQQHKSKINPAQYKKPINTWQWQKRRPLREKKCWPQLSFPSSTCPVGLITSIIKSGLGNSSMDWDRPDNKHLQSLRTMQLSGSWLATVFSLL